jgi:hypothetical protein
MPVLLRASNPAFRRFQGSYKSAEHAQAIDAAIGNDIDPKMCHCA